MATSEGAGFLESLGDDLAMKLGHAIWGFAKIEWVVCDFIARLSNDDVLFLVGEQPFHSRVAMLRKLIDRTEVDETVKKKAKDSLAEAEQLAKKRNICVHNPWQTYIRMSGSGLASEIWRHSNNEHKLTVDEVVELASEAANLADQLRDDLSALTMRSSGP
jgi:hypothetical protein